MAVSLKISLDELVQNTSKPEKIWTVIELIKWGTDFFQKKEIDSPRLNIELLLAEVLNYSRIQIYTNYDTPLTKEELAILKDYVLRRAKREPLQYILGFEKFYGLKYYLNRDTLIPRPETEILAEKAINFLKENNQESFKIADLCSGSGCIGITIANKVPNSMVHLYDISENALEISKKNALENEVTNVCFNKADLLADEINENEFDLIVSNPPYISIEDSKELQDEVKLFEPRIAYCDEADGLTFYRSFKNTFLHKLKRGGSALLEFGFGEESDIIKIFIDDYEAIDIINDYSNIPRIAFLKNKK